MLVEWGYIDKDDLSIAQKKSAKELKDLELVNLKIAETKLKMENMKGSVPKKDEARYNAALKGFNQALKDKDYALAEVHRNEINSIMPTGDTSNYTKLIDDGMKKAKIKTPKKVFDAYGVEAKDYIKSKQSIIEKVNFLKESKATSKEFDLWMTQNTIGQDGGGNKGTTYERFFQTQGIFSWDKVDPDKNEKLPEGARVPKHALESEEAYFSWALPEIEKKLMIGIWGNLHNEVSAINDRKFEEVKSGLADNIIRMAPPWEIEKQKKEAEKKEKEAEKKKKLKSKIPPPPIKQPTDIAEKIKPTTGTAEEVQTAIDTEKKRRSDKRMKKLTEKVKKNYRNLVNKNEWEKFEKDVMPELAAMDKEELEDTLKTMLPQLKRKKDTGQDTGFDEMTLKYIEALLKNK